jgi:hypothetical protein
MHLRNYPCRIAGKQNPRILNCPFKVGQFS